MLKKLTALHEIMHIILHKYVSWHQLNLLKQQNLRYLEKYDCAEEK